jgi:putative ATP-dependent endonuclease of OLD family
MYVSKIKLWNFRKYGNGLAIDIDKPSLIVNLTPGLNVLIGSNDSGKTAIIDAVKIVLKTHSQEWITITDSDFFEESKELRIEIICKGMSDEEAKNFTEWLGWEDSSTGVSPFLRLMYSASRTEDRILPSEIRAGVDATGKIMNAEARDYLKTTYLKPLRDAKSELIAKRGSRLSQIFRGHSAFKGKNQTHHLVKSFDNLNKEIKEYFKGREANGVTKHADQEGKILKDKIDEFVKAFCGDSELSDIKASEGDLISILERLEIVILDRLNPGLGTLNRLFMGTELVHISKDPWTGLRLGLVEELEAHLSPQAQMQVIEKLQSEKDMQLILTTHSPNLASKVKLKNLIMCVGDSVFPLGSEYTELDADDYIFLEKFLDVTKSNLFFAKGIILVEGWSEEILIPSLAKSLGFDLTKYGVSVVNVGNLSFLHYSRIFRRKEPGEKMRVPVSVVTDVDVAYYSRTPSIVNGELIKKSGRTVYEYHKRDKDIIDPKVTAKKNSINENLKKDDVHPFIAPLWTLEFSLSKSTLLGEKFKEIVKAIHKDTDWETDFEASLAKMLLNGSLDKTKIAYKLAQALDTDATPMSAIIDTDSAHYLIKAIKHACSAANN